MHFCGSVHVSFQAPGIGLVRITRGLGCRHRRLRLRNLGLGALVLPQIQFWLDHTHNLVGVPKIGFGHTP